MKACEPARLRSLPGNVNLPRAFIKLGRAGGPVQRRHGLARRGNAISLK